MIFHPLMVLTSSTISIQTFLCKASVSLTKSYRTTAKCRRRPYETNRIDQTICVAISWNKCVLQVKIGIENHRAVDGYGFSQRDMKFKSDLPYCCEITEHIAAVNHWWFLQEQTPRLMDMSVTTDTQPTERWKRPGSRWFPIISEGFVSHSGPTGTARYQRQR